MDYGERVTERGINSVNKKLRATYKTAQRELEVKLAEFNRKFAEKDRRKQAQLAAGEITQQAYKDWLAGQVFMRGQWETKLNEVCSVLHTSNVQAAKIVQQGKLDVFSENYNYTAYVAERKTGVSFDIYNTSAVAKLIEDDPQTLPEWKIDKKKDYVWNKQKVNNSIMQGIIQGEGIDKITKRLCEDLATKNENKMRLFARTAMTGAQNAGRQQHMEEAAKMGIKQKKRWVATLDKRTRDAHRYLDGQEVPIDEPFKSILGDIDFPGDPMADPANTYNCRCRIVTIYPKYEDYSKPDWREAEIIEGQTYAEWKQGKKNRGEIIGQKASNKPTRTAVQGKDITGTWKRRESEFSFEINDVMNAQGFDGLPNVVSKEEFDKAVKKSSFIAQRTYTAPDQETLDLYREQLYNGDWYVDCSTGGAQYGQGMYCAADYDGKLTDGIKAEMSHYQDLGYDRNRSAAKESAKRTFWNKKLEGATEEEIAMVHRELTNTATEEERKLARAWEKQNEEAYYNAYDKYKKFAFEADKVEREAVPVSYTETITLSKDARIIDYKELVDIQRGNLSIDYRTERLAELLDKSDFNEEEKKFARYDLGLGGSWNEAFAVANKIGEEETSKLTERVWKLGEKATELYNEEHERRIEESRVYREKYGDVGSLATALGYDAINAEGHGESGSYTVILNRTKCIFLGGS